MINYADIIVAIIIFCFGIIMMWIITYKFIKKLRKISNRNVYNEECSIIYV